MDISLASTEELASEIAHRHAASVITAVNHDNDLCLFFHGSGLLCSGLLTNAQFEFTRASMSGERDTNP